MRIRLDPVLMEALVGHFRACLPEEGCGFLIGRSSTPSRFLPAPNALRSRSAFEVEPRFLFDLYRDLRASGEEVVALCHSHPQGPPVPSRRDLASMPDPDWFSVIVSLASEDPEIRAWRIIDGAPLEVELHASI